MTLHLEFPRRTETGPATFEVREVKLGRATSTVHVTLSQAGGREEVLAYVTHADLRAEDGVTFPTGWALSPRPRPAVLLAPMATTCAPILCAQSPFGR